jgi:hypothetical protein
MARCRRLRFGVRGAAQRKQTVDGVPVSRTRRDFVAAVVVAVDPFSPFVQLGTVPFQHPTLPCRVVSEDPRSAILMHHPCPSQSVGFLGS